MNINGTTAGYPYPQTGLALKKQVDNTATPVAENITNKKENRDVVELSNKTGYNYGYMSDEEFQKIRSYNPTFLMKSPAVNSQGRLYGSEFYTIMDGFLYRGYYCR